MSAYRDGVKGKETRLGWDYNSHIVCMCIIIRWSRNHSPSWAERFQTSSLLCTYIQTIIVPSQSCLLSYLHHFYMRPFSICKICHLLVYVRVIQMKQQLLAVNVQYLMYVNSILRRWCIQYIISKALVHGTVELLTWAHRCMYAMEQLIICYKLGMKI